MDVVTHQHVCVNRARMSFAQLLKHGEVDDSIAIAKKARASE